MSREITYLNGGYIDLHGVRLDRGAETTPVTSGKDIIILPVTYSHSVSARRVEPAPIQSPSLTEAAR